jgi:hypothetical protein
MKVSSWNSSVMPPNTTMIARLAHCIGSTFLPRSFSHAICSDGRADRDRGGRVDVRDLEGHEEQQHRETGRRAASWASSGLGRAVQPASEASPAATDPQCRPDG